MSERHPLDGNAIAADRHYGEAPPENCSICGEPLEATHARFVDLCQECGEDQEEAPDED